MIKRITVIICILAMLFYSLALNICAEDCRCGRELVTVDDPNINTPVCEHCKQPLTDCTCKCWCGASTELTANGGLICNGCGQLCVSCTCADKSAMLNYEKAVSEGRIAAGKVQKPDGIFLAIMLIVVVVTLTSVFTVVCAIMKKKEIDGRKVEETEMMQQHNKLLEKIEKQARKETEDADIIEKEYKDAVRCVKWRTSDIKPGTALFEVANSANYDNKEIYSASSLTLYLACAVINAEAATDKAIGGVFGNCIQDICLSQNEDTRKVTSSVFGDTFISRSKISVNEILNVSDISAEEIENLANLPYSLDVKCGSAEPQATRWAKETYETYTAPHKMDKYFHRFIGDRGEPK